MTRMKWNRTLFLVINRNLVRKYCRFMNKELGCLNIGIIDMDYDGIRDLMNSKYEKKLNPKTIYSQ